MRIFATKLGCALLIIILILQIFVSFSSVGEEEIIEPLQTFTHAVLCEEVTATWCGYCPSVAEALNNIYQSNDYPFYFVALITDVNNESDDRANDDYNIPGYPTTIFDGGYITEVGSSGTPEENEARFRPDIEQCGEREVYALEIDIQAYHRGDAVIEVYVNVANQESSNYGGHIRTYIVEKVSRYNNADNNPYHMGFLDYAFDEDISIEPNSNWENIMTWDGAEHEDSLGNDFGDLDPENILIIAAVFNDDIHIGTYPPYPIIFAAYYVDQTNATDVLPPAFYDVDISPSSQSDVVAPGESTVYPLSVQNNGNRDDVYTVSLSGAQSNWGTLSHTQVSLSPGLSQGITLTVDVPPGTSEGSYYIYVTATSSNDPSAQDTATTITVVETPPQYDVDLFCVESSKTAKPGESISYTITIENTGNTDDTIDITKSGPYSAWGTLSQITISLTSGSSGDVTLIVDVPSDAFEGDYDIFVRGTSQGDPLVYDEIITTTTVEQIFYDVVLSSDLTFQTTHPGTSTNFTITVENGGNVDDTINMTILGVYSAWGTLSDTTLSLSEGGTQDITLTVDVPSDATEGEQYPINVRGTSQGNSTVWHEITLTVMVEPYIYEVNLSCSQLSLTTNPGTSIEFEITVENRGNTDDIINLTKSGLYSSWGTLSDTQLSLSEGGSQEITLTVDVPSDAAGGEYTINVRGTSQGNTSIYSEISVTTIVEPYYYGIVLSCSEPNMTSKPGTWINYTIRVDNTGNTNDTVNITKSGPYSDWGTFSDTNIYLYEGFSTDFTLSVEIPSDAVEGDYPIYVRGTSQGNTSIFDEITITSTVEPFIYDVNLSCAQPSKITKPGRTLTFNITVQNRGETDDTIDITKSGPASDWSTLSDTTIVLGSGESGIITLTVDIPSDASEGDYYTYVRGTSQGNLSIFDELRVTITVEPFVYDVIMFSDEPNMPARPGTSANFTITVMNNGDTDDTIDITKSGDYSSWGTLSQTSLYLLPDELEDLILTVEVPSDASGGDYPIYVRGTSQGNTSEYMEIILTTTVEPYHYAVNLSSEETNQTTKPGNTLVYIITVTNNGDTTDSIEVTISEEGTNWGMLNQTWISLLPNRSQDITLTVNVPWEANGGNYDIHVRGTSQGNTSVFSEIIMTTTVEPFIYEVNMTSEITSLTTKPGKSVIYTITLENRGEINDTIDITILGANSQWGSLSNSSILLEPLFPKDITLTVEIPFDTQGGEYVLDVRGTSQGNSSIFAELTFITVVKEYHYEAHLSVEPSSLMARPGDTLNYTMTIVNKGEINDTFIMTLSGEQSDWGTLNNTTIFLVPNQDVDLTLTVEVPPEAEGDNYTFCIRCTSQGNSSVFSEISIVTTVEPYVYGVDLEPDYQEDTVEKGDTIFYSISVKNTGNTHEIIDLSISGIKAGWASLSNYSLNLASGDLQNIILTIVVPESADANEYSFRIKGIYIGDLSIYDNIDVKITVISTSNVTIEDVYHSPIDPTDKEEITISATLIGDNVQSVYLDYWLGTTSFLDNTMEDKGSNQYSVTIGPLDAGDYEYEVRVIDDEGNEFSSGKLNFIVYQDSDGDGTIDEDDAFPEDPDEWLDTDDDGVGDNSDDFPKDSTQTKDSDGDGYGDNPDGNNPDAYPDDPTRWEMASTESETPWYESQTGMVYIGLIISIIFIVLILLIFIIRRRSREEGETEIFQLIKEEPEEIMEFTPITETQLENITCPSCRTSFEVPTEPRPMSVQCPNCKITGTVH